MLKGIDISNYQAGLDVSAIDADFIIIKASEGVNWYDKAYESFAPAILACGKRLGLYHFARPVNNVLDDANTFIRAFKPYVGKAIPVLDWEAENQHDVVWAKAWLDEVYNQTGVRPWIYMSESVVNSYDWSEVAKKYGLWVAKYRDYDVDYNYDMAMAGAEPNVKHWEFVTAWQWTSSGRLDGWNGNLDCNVFYGDGSAWDRYCGEAQSAQPVPTPAPAPQPSTCKYGVGTTVCTGHIWVSSTSTDAGYTGDWQYEITRVIPGAPHPYLLGDTIGWTDDASIDADPHVPGVAQTGGCKYGVGQRVCTGVLATSSTGGTVFTGDWRGTITKVVPGTEYPYLLNDGTGWTNDTGIDNDPHSPY